MSLSKIIWTDNEAYYKYMHTPFVLRQLLIFFFYDEEDRRLPAISPNYGVVFPATTIYCLPTTIIPTIFLKSKNDVSVCKQYDNK